LFTQRTFQIVEIAVTQAAQIAADRNAAGRRAAGDAVGGFKRHLRQIGQQITGNTLAGRGLYRK